MAWRDTLGVAVKRLLYEGYGRDRWQQPDRVIAALELKPGETIADLGSGTGYFTLQFARTVGSQGSVYAVDTDEGLLRAIAKTAADRGLGNVQTVHAEDGGLRLPTPVDIIFLSNVYHHLPEQAGYFVDARAQLAPGGRVAILESKPEGWFARLFGHATDPAVIESTMTRAGYRLMGSHDFVDRHSFLVFQPGGPSAAESSAAR